MKRTELETTPAVESEKPSRFQKTFRSANPFWDRRNEPAFESIVEDEETGEIHREQIDRSGGWAPCLG